MLYASRFVRDQIAGLVRTLAGQYHLVGRTPWSAAGPPASQTYLVFKSADTSDIFERIIFDLGVIGDT